MIINMATAAGYHDHYIRLALERAGVPITAEMELELASARDAYAELDAQIARLIQAAPSAGARKP